MDAIDSALVEFERDTFRLHTFHSFPIPSAIRQRLVKFIEAGNEATINEYAALDIIMGRLFADAVKALLDQTQIESERILAIGSHGQNVFHSPDSDTPTSLQIGDPNMIAELTGITTVADFRRRDVAAGGQGAPLAPAFHQIAFGSTDEHRCVVNIGGIANITVLPADKQHAVIGFDTGPGNTLMDYWANKQSGTACDMDGALASQGQPDANLVKKMMGDAYFSASIPKSTGREYFNAHWLNKYLADDEYKAEDVQASLCALTANTILQAVRQNAPEAKTLIVCGGGSHNPQLMRYLKDNRHNIQVVTTMSYGIDPDHVEAIAFAWLARQTLAKQAGNLPTVTGASHAAILGGVYQGQLSSER